MQNISITVSSQNNLIYNLKAIGYLIAIILPVRLALDMPWWGFVIPVIGLGVLIKKKGWAISFLLCGFTSGFVLWIGAYLYFHYSFNGSILNRNGFVPMVVVLIATGLIGGVVTAMAFYTGKLMGNLHNRKFVL